MNILFFLNVHYTFLYAKTYNNAIYAFEIYYIEWFSEKSVDVDLVWNREHTNKQTFLI